MSKQENVDLEAIFILEKIKTNHMKTLFYFLLFAKICSGQVTQKSITVQGTAKLRVRPDIAWITFRFEKSDTSQAKAMAKANQLADLVSALLLNQGLPSKQIKISEYSVTNSYNNEQRRKGYTVSNTLIARAGFEERWLNQLLKAVDAQRINDLDISFDYTLSDSLEKLARTKLVQEVIFNAKTNAETISRTLNIPLKGILQVLKHWPEATPIPQLESAKFTPPVIKRDEDIKYDSIFQQFEVEEKELTEEVTLIYEIGT